jgi:hypothetical protein
MLLGQCIRDRRGRNEAAPDQDFSEASARALLLGECLDKIVLADQSSFHQQCAESTPTRICRIHTTSYQPTAGTKPSFGSLRTAPSARA